MGDFLQRKLVSILRWSEKYTGTDMVYLASGGAWLVFEQFIGVLLSFGLATAFGHFAVPDMYGNYKYVLSIAALIGALSLSRLGDAVGQSAARGNDGVLRQGFWLSLRWSWVFVSISLITAAYYAFVAGNQFLAAALVIVTLTQPLLSSGSLFSSFLFGKRDFMRGSLYLASVNAITTLSVFVALFLGERAIILVATYFIARTIAALYASMRARQHATNTHEDPRLFNYGAHLSAMGVIGAIADVFDYIIIFTLLGPAKLAIYAFAVAIPEQIKGVVKNMHGLAFPKFANKSLPEIRATITRKLLVLTIGITGLIFLYIFAAPYIFDIFFPLYTEAVVYSQWYALSIVFAGVSQILYSALYAHKRTRDLYIVSNVPPILLLISLIGLVPLYGIAGAIASQIIFRGSNFILSISLFVLVKDSASQV